VNEKKRYDNACWINIGQLYGLFDRFYSLNKEALFFPVLFYFPNQMGKRVKGG
jgi:hypothetical protein